MRSVLILIDVRADNISSVPAISERDRSGNCKRVKLAIENPPRGQFLMFGEFYGGSVFVDVHTLHFTSDRRGVRLRTSHKLLLLWSQLPMNPNPGEMFFFIVSGSWETALSFYHKEERYHADEALSCSQYILLERLNSSSAFWNF